MSLPWRSLRCAGYARRRGAARAAVVVLFTPGRPPRRRRRSPQDELKKQAAWKAVEYVESGMKVGLGTGSTAAFAVARVGELLASGELKDIVAVPTSIATYEQAKGTVPAARDACTNGTAD